jgi:hypothetical protein
MNTHATTQEPLDVGGVSMQSVSYHTLKIYWKGSTWLVLPRTSTFMSGQRGTAWLPVGSAVFCLHCLSRVYWTLRNKWVHISLVFICCDCVCLLVDSCGNYNSMPFQTVLKEKWPNSDRTPWKLNFSSVPHIGSLWGDRPGYLCP